MEKDAKIYVAGHTGLVGSAIVRHLKSKGYSNFVFTPHSHWDLRNQQQVNDFFDKQRPDYVFLAAAHVGGIWANNVYRAEFVYDNLMIESNIIHYSYVYGVKKLLFLGSSCIYPKLAPQPLKEEYLLTDALEYTNEPYAISKIAGIKLAESYNMQYGTNFLSVMPTNLYGENDNFDLEKSHVLPALIRKFHLGKLLKNNDWQGLRQDLDHLPIEGISGSSSDKEIIDILQKYGIYSHGHDVYVTLWGTGSPMREFLHSDDLADAVVYLMETVDFEDILREEYNVTSPTYPLVGPEVRNTHINIGVGEDISIRDLANLVKSIIGFDGQIIWNKSKPDGTPRKLLDVSKLFSYGWRPKIPLDKGIESVYHAYLQGKAKAR